MKYLHTMIRVSNLDQSLDFFINKLGFVEQRRYENEKGRFTLVFVAAPESPDAPVELTYNWDPEAYTGGRNFGHLALEVDNIYDYCDKLQKTGHHHQPAAARRAHGLHQDAGRDFDRAPQQGRRTAAAKEPWASMPNTGNLVNGSHFPSSRHQLAAIDLDHLAGDVAGRLLAREKEEGAGAVLGRPEPPHGDGLARRFELFRRRMAVVEGGVDGAGRHGIDADVLVAASSLARVLVKAETKPLVPA